MEKSPVSVRANSTRTVVSRCSSTTPPINARENTCATRVRGGLAQCGHQFTPSGYRQGACQLRRRCRCRGACRGESLDAGGTGVELAPHRLAAAPVGFASPRPGEQIDEPKPAAVLALK